MEAVRADSNQVKRPKQSVKTPEGMLKNFLIRNIGPRKLKDLYMRLKPEDKAKFILGILPFVQSRKAAEPFSEEEINELHDMINQKANETVKKVSQG